MHSSDRFYNIIINFGKVEVTVRSVFIPNGHKFTGMSGV